MQPIRFSKPSVALLFGLLVNAPPVAAAEPEVSAMEVCGGNSQAGIRQCLDANARENAQLLRQAENRMIAAIAKWDEDEKFIKAATAKFTAAGKAYATYRTTQCAFASSLGGGAIGNALQMRQLACLIDLDSARTQLLNTSAGTLPR